MKLQPGDQIQIILTVGGVPYAKTWPAGTLVHKLPKAALGAMAELLMDINLYGDEHEEEAQQG